MKNKIVALILVIILCIVPTSIVSAFTCYSISSSSEEKDTIFIGTHYDYSAALAANGNLYCWGENTLAQVGNGTTSSVAKPFKVLSNVASFKGIETNVAAITQSGDLYIWGTNASSLLGNGQTSYKLEQLTPLKVLSNVASVYLEEAAGYYHNSIAVITKSGDLYSWGYTGGGQVGNGQSGLDVYQTSPVKILSNVASVKSYDGAVAAVTKSGDLYMWGKNNFGQVGNGQSGVNVYQTSPVKVLSNVASISLNSDSVAALATNGDLYCWGNNWQGRVGNGSSETQTTPVKVLSDVAYANADRVTTAIKENGDLYCWGYAENGQVGNGMSGIEDRQTTPVKIMENVAMVRTQHSNTAAVTTDGDLYCWGGNEWGQIGNGTLVRQVTPVKVLSNVALLNLEGVRASAITKNGDLYCWGENGTGKVGNGKSGFNQYGESIVQTTPIKVLGSVAYSMFSTDYSAAVTKNGDLYHWGYKVATPSKVLTGVKLPDAAPSTPALMATPTASKVMVDGKNVSFDAYNIAGNNYFKLRDLAYVVNGSTKQFAVGYDDGSKAITLNSGESYTPVGGELSKGDGKAKNALPTKSKIFVNGKETPFTAYNIGGNNYFKLRDVTKVFNIGVGYDDASKVITINTDQDYED